MSHTHDVAHNLASWIRRTRPHFHVPHVPLQITQVPCRAFKLRTALMASSKRTSSAGILDTCTAGDILSNTYLRLFVTAVFSTLAKQLSWAPVSRRTRWSTTADVDGSRADCAAQPTTPGTPCAASPRRELHHEARTDASRSDRNSKPLFRPNSHRCSSSCPSEPGVHSSAVHPRVARPLCTQCSALYPATYQLASHPPGAYLPGCPGALPPTTCCVAAGSFCTVPDASRLPAPALPPCGAAGQLPKQSSTH